MAGGSATNDPASMSRRALLLTLAALLAAGLGLWASQRIFGAAAPATHAPPLPATKAATVLPQPRPVPAFELQQSDGTALTPEELKGHWTVVFLGFTHCPDICPTTLAQLSAAQKQWQSIPQALRPRVLFVSADPERDNPQRVGEYAHAFHPDTLAATAPLQQLEPFARSLSLVFMKVPGRSGAAQDYSIDHSAALVLLDPQARFGGVIQPPLDVQAIASDLALLTAASAGAAP